jgi:DNA-binding transcriptional regulator YbjK
MKTAEIIDALNHLTIAGSEDYVQLDRLDELTAQLQQNHDGQLACAAMLSVLERHPQVHFGAPGQLVHAIESYRGHYENLLLSSLARQPMASTIWLLSRIINAATDAEKDQLLVLMERLQTHLSADEQAKVAAEEFYRFQTGEA